MKCIRCTNGMFALVDDQDFDELSKSVWTVVKDKHNYYASRHITVDGKRTTIKMHTQLIGKPGPGLVTDHFDGNGLNNQRNNIKHVTNSYNLRKSSLYSTNISGKHGVTYSSLRRKWKVVTGFGRHYKFVGYFEELKDALIAKENA